MREKRKSIKSMWLPVTNEHRVYREQDQRPKHKKKGKV